MSANDDAKTHREQQELLRDRTELDWEELRADFPVLTQEVHGRPLAYLDNAASSQMPRQVLDEINWYQTRAHSNVHRGVHALSQRATDAYELARERVAELIGSPSPNQCIFTKGATEAINLVMYAWGFENVEEGDEILISGLEHHANIVPWQMLCKRVGARLRVMPIDQKGEWVFDDYDELLSDRTALVALSHVSNALGTVNPIGEAIEKAHARDVPVLVDGCQAVPHMTVDVQALDADFYAFSGHKMCGPTGIGILYAKKEILDEMGPFQGGGDMIRNVTFEESTYADAPHRFEAGTPPIMPAVGLGAAATYLQSIGLGRIAAREQELLAYATEKLEAVSGVRIIGTAPNKAAVISFEVEGVHPHDVGTILDSEGVAIRAGHHCAQPVMEHFEVAATARASLAFYNNRADIDSLVSALSSVKDIFGV
jgi:cysteine desulfurase/selenocysteine lyase